jgi:hypothetical protein
MAKQTFTTGQVLTAAQMTSLQQTAMGGGSTTAKTTSYVLTAADAGTVIQMNSASATTITVNTALFAAGDTVQIQNIGAGVCTVTAGTATVNTYGSLALSQYQGGQLYFNTTSAAFLYGVDASTSSGGMTLLSTTALAGSTTTVSSISGAYNKLWVEIIDCYPGTAGALNLRFNTDSTANAYQGVYNYYPADATSGTQRAPYIQKDTSYLLCFGSIAAADNNNYSWFEIQNYASSTVRKTLNSQSMYTNTGSNATVDVSGGAWLNVAAITSISIIGAGAFSGGSIKIWGIK